MTHPSLPTHRSKPTPGQPITFQFPAFSHTRSERGHGVLVLPRNDLPLVALELLRVGGGSAPSGAAPGAVAITAALLQDGTTRRNALQIACTVEESGGHLGAGAGWDDTSVSAVFLQEHFDTFLELLIECANQPAFEEAEIERQRSRRLAEISRREQDPSSLANVALARALFDGRPYEYPLIGTADSLSKLQREDILKEFEHLAHQPTALCASGDLNDQQIDALANAVDQLPTSTHREPMTPLTECSPGATIVDRPHGTQTELRIGHLGPKRSHPDRLALVLANLVLGGKFTSRLNLNLREEHGITYGVNSRFQGCRDWGTFAVSAAIENEAVGLAVREVLAEMGKMQDELVPVEELQDAKSYMLGVFPYTLQTVDGLAGALEDLYLYDFPDDHYDTLPARVQAITAEDVQRAARDHLKPDASVVVAVGPEQTLRPQIEGLSLPWRGL